MLWAVSLVMRAVDVDVVAAAATSAAADDARVT
jgi:hypothetical protein